MFSTIEGAKKRSKSLKRFLHEQCGHEFALCEVQFMVVKAAGFSHWYAMTRSLATKHPEPLTKEQFLHNLLKLLPEDKTQEKVTEWYTRNGKISGDGDPL